MTGSNTGFFGHPKGLAILFFTEMWERFSYYGMRAILIFYMTSEVINGGMELPAKEAAAIYGLYTAAVYLLALPGGWFADKLVGQQKSILYGGIIIMIGHIILAFPADKIVFFTGLATVALGTGLLKPNISAIVAELYPEGGARRDAGFSIFYMGINLGSFLGQIIVPYLGEKVDWHMGFGAAAVGMFLGIIVYVWGRKPLLKEAGLYPNIQQEKVFETGEKKENKSNQPMLIILTVILAIVLVLFQQQGYFSLETAETVAYTTGIIMLAVTVYYFLIILLAFGLNWDEQRKVMVLIVLFAASAIFWSGFEQAGSSLNLFALDHTNRFIFGWEMPAGWLQSANSVFIFIFAPVFAAIWVKLAQMNLNPSTPLKFAFGLLFMALGFLTMVFAAKIVTMGGKAGYFWLIMTYFLHTVGELCLSPVGLSAYTKLSPKRYVSQMMGLWFVSVAMGNLIAGLFAGGFSKDNVNQLPDLFMFVVYLGAIPGFLLLITSPFIKKWMGNVK